MSNDKAAATYHGETDPALALTIESAEIRGYACGRADAKYHQRPLQEDWAAARQWAASYGYRTQTVTPGPHAEINRKRSFNPEAVSPPAAGSVWCCWMGKHSNGAEHVLMCKNHRTNTDGHRETTGEHTKAKLEDDLYRRGWAPTKREIQVAAALFFVLVAVSGWVFRALG